MNTYSRVGAVLKALAVGVATAALLTSCASVRVVPGGNVQTGAASWYGPDFQGKRTSNKEIYDMYDMTAAHKTLPFGTRVMVTNLDNSRTAVVRINDRGPFIEGRIIDLSYAAARVLDMVESGVAPVRLEILRGQQPPGLTAPKYSVQVGSFISKANARALENELKRTFRNVYITEYATPHQVYYRVRIKASDLESSRDIAQRLSESGHIVLILEEE